MGRLQAFLDVLGGSFDDSGPFWIVSGTSCGPFGPSGLFWARKKNSRQAAGSREKHREPRDALRKNSEFRVWSS